MKKRILFLHVSIGSGHIRAAQAIEDAIKKRHKDWETRSVDPSAEKYPAIKKIIEKIYLKSNKYIPKVYDLLYDSETIYRMSKPFVRYFQKKNLERFRDYIEDFNPEIIVCTHAFPCGMASILKERTDINIVAVPTDLTVHRYWVQKNVDCFAVATDKSKDFLIKRGVKKEDIEVTGLPINPKFYKDHDKEELRKRLSLREGNIILIMGGGFGFGPIEETIRALKGIDAELVAITGRNKKLKEKLNRLDMKNLKVLSYIKNIDMYMEASDLLITKPSGSTIYEAASKGLPMVLIKGVAGSEWDNKEFLEGLVEVPKDKEELRMKTESIIDDKEKRDSLRKRLKAFVKPDATERIVNILERM